MANTDTVKRIVGRIIDNPPAAVLIAGGFLYHPMEEEPGDVRDSRDELERADLEEMRSQIAEVVSMLKPLLTAGIPTFAVLGNHDYARGLRPHGPCRASRMN